ncbi:2OG-Fe(II) oxygenase [Nocardia sp. NPDC005366]|uniref:2OG-Fe(II) oxygenase n=1 Tax=Nocardia sp. NPDC005366 TaxID=3156878 RepID=UPI0033B45949
MLPSIIRRWPRGGHANPHIDQRLLPLLDSFELKRRIGVNVYIQTPEAGGEIEFWDRRSNEDNYVTTKRSDYSLDREGLGEPHLSLRPCQGDLIMFDAARLHGVRRVSVGSRVTSACFLGVRSTAEPLIVFA